MFNNTKSFRPSHGITWCDRRDGSAPRCTKHGLYRKVDTKTTFVTRFEYGLQPYKEEMQSKGSGSMKMNDEEIKMYTEAISRNSDNLFVCPRCEAHTDKLKANIKTHLQRKKPCMPSSSSSVVHQNVQVTNDHSTHISNHDHSTHNTHNTHNTTINNANITIQLQPINCPNPDWEDLVNNNCIKTTEKRLGCSLPDAASALLACLKFQHLNADVPQRHNVRITDDGDLEIYCFADELRRKNAAWRQAWNASFQANGGGFLRQGWMTWKTYPTVTFGDLKDVSLIYC
ncbi:hypothetical protein ABBQ38_006372 [Trebouxia sp. C0009 RCD-2024]